MLFLPAALDAAVLLQFLGYGIAVLWLAAGGPDAFVGARLSHGVLALRAARATGLALIESAAIDLAIAADLALAEGAHAPLIVGVAQTFLLALLGVAIATAGRSVPEVEPAREDDAAAPTGPSEDESAMVERLDALIVSQRLYRLPDLTLERLARRALTPARQLSVAVNRVRGESVSRYLNRFRVAEACRLLAETGQPVTSVMLEAGFQTKSNFNRVFREATGMGPSEWRAAHSRRPAGTP
jgi:AraC-like DNA-binding protein